MTARIHCLVSERDPLETLPGLVNAGVDGFQVRAKGLDTRALLDLVEGVIVAAGDRAEVIVNDRVDVALAAGADGVHLGADDLPVGAARRIAPGLLLGATCRNRADVEAAAGAGADYAGFGPIFTTHSKGSDSTGGDSRAGLPEPLGPEAIATATGILPLVAIGGVTAANAAAVRAAGAHGVAVIGGIWGAPDPAAATKELLDALGG